MATVVPDRPNPLAEALQKLGIAFVSRASQEEAREEELMRDTARMQSLLPSARAAAKAGPEALAAFDRALGTNPGFSEKAILQLQPTTDQLISEKFQEKDGATLAVNLQINQMARDNETLTAEMVAGLPWVRVNREVAEAGAATEEAEGRERQAARSNEIGAPEVLADVGLLKAHFEQFGIEFETAKLEKYTNYLNSLDPTGREYREAVIGLTNPAELAHIATHERLDAESALRMAALGQVDLGDKIALTTDVREWMNTAVDRLEELEANGADKTVIDQAKADVENVRLLGQMLMERDAVFGLDLVGAEGKKGKFELIPYENASITALTAIDNLNKALAETDDPSEVLEAFMKEYSQANLTPRDREELDRQLQSINVQGPSTERDPGLVKDLIDAYAVPGVSVETATAMATMTLVQKLTPFFQSLRQTIREDAASPRR